MVGNYDWSVLGWKVQQTKTTRMFSNLGRALVVPEHFEVLGDAPKALPSFMVAQLRSDRADVNSFSSTRAPISVEAVRASCSMKIRCTGMERGLSATMKIITTTTTARQGLRPKIGCFNMAQICHDQANNRMTNNFYPQKQSWFFTTQSSKP